LCSQEDIIKGQEPKRQRWEIDPAGNRLPVELTDEKQQQDWAQMVYQNWKGPSFNLLRNDDTLGRQLKTIFTDKTKNSASPTLAEMVTGTYTPERQGTTVTGTSCTWSMNRAPSRRWCA